MLGVLSRPPAGGVAGATGRRRPPRGPRRARLLDRREAWTLLPLRVCIGLTFIVTGVRQLADRAFLKASSPTSVHAQLQRAAHAHGFLGSLAHHAALIGVLIVLVELAVGSATVLGLWARATAAVGAALSLFLAATLTRPLSHGADVVLAFAFTPLIIGGAGPVSVDGLAQAEARRRLDLPGDPEVIVGFDAVRQLCGAYSDGRCSARRDHRCSPDGCPALALSTAPAAAAEVERRAFLQKAGVAGWVGAAAIVGAGLSALIGRVAPSKSPKRTPAPPPSTVELTPSTASPATAAPPTASSTPTAAEAASPPGSASTTTPAPPATQPAPAPAGFTNLGPTSAVPVGGAAAFTDPATGDQSFVVQPVAGQFVAFDASCTHEGCPVRYAGTTFQCPCHGAQFDSATGKVLRGPANTPLRRISVKVIGATLYAS